MGLASRYTSGSPLKPLLAPYRYQAFDRIVLTSDIVHQIHRISDRNLPIRILEPRANAVIPISDLSWHSSKCQRIALQIQMHELVYEIVDLIRNKLAYYTLESVGIY